MNKTILITGSTDGIGLETARILVSQGHHVLLHGRNRAKLEAVAKSLSRQPGAGPIESYVADLSHMPDVEALADAVADKHDRLDVLINNAGILQAPDPITPDGLDVRFAVNTIAPYLLTKRLMPLFATTSRVINVSSAARSPVDLQALAGRVKIADDYQAYAQSKLALNMWSRSMALSFQQKGPMIVAVNPGSLLGTKMVKEGFGVDGGDILIGANILVLAALSDEFSTASGKYFDNDSGEFAEHHPDALDPVKSQEIIQIIEVVLDDYCKH